MSPTRVSAFLGLAFALSLATVGTAEAGEGFRQGGFHGGFHRGRGVPFYGYSGYGFADATVSGDFVGAPYARFPRPRELVPSAWGYGTYGIPTMPGIRQAPTAQPTVYVVDTPTRPARRAATGPRILSRGSDGQWAEPAAAPASTGGGAHVVNVSVSGR